MPMLLMHVVQVPGRHLIGPVDTWKPDWLPIPLIDWLQQAICNASPSH